MSFTRQYSNNTNREFPIRIGITGQSGFIGTHLYSYLSLKKDTFQLIYFQDDFFDSQESLTAWVRQCDVIVHLAGVNRHASEDVIYQVNLELSKKLITALEAEKHNPHILFSSSLQEEKDNPYGHAKKESRELLANWAAKNGSGFTGLVIPNVFGPFGNPYYNSVIATFCHQLSHNEKPEIQIDGELKLIYVQELVTEISHIIESGIYADSYKIPYTSTNKVSEILKILTDYQSVYYKNYTFPEFKSAFELNLFNTFRCYIDHASFFPCKLKLNIDERGSFVETIKARSGGQCSFSTTKPGITRGDHFHIRKIERFVVIKGKAAIKLRRIGTNKIFEFILDGKEPAFVDMPVWYTHNITNIGNDDLYTLFWINEFFDPADPDTYFEKV